jgi:hypothetical protein
MVGLSATKCCDQEAVVDIRVEQRVPECRELPMNRVAGSAWVSLWTGSAAATTSGVAPRVGAR